MNKIGILYRLNLGEVHNFLDFIGKHDIASMDIGSSDDFAEYSLMYPDGKPASTIKRDSGQFYEMVVREGSQLEQIVRKYQKR